MGVVGFAGTAVAVCAGATGATGVVEVDLLPSVLRPPEVPNWGGVIETTAPRPPTVPPSMRKSLLLIITFYSL